MKRTITAVVLFFLAAFGIVAVVWIRSSSAAEVQTAEVQLGVIGSSVTTNGIVESERVHEVRALLSAACRKILVSEGAVVREGQELVILDDSSLRAELVQARAEAEAAETELKLIARGPAPEEVAQADAEIARTRLDLETSRKTDETNVWLLERNAISQFEAEQSRNEVARARQALAAAEARKREMNARYGEPDRDRAAARLEAARSRVKLVEGSLAKTILRAPAAGTLLQFGLKDGAWVNEGELVGQVADVGRNRVRIFIDEPDLARVTRSADVTITWDARPREVWKGRIFQLPSRVVPRGSRSVGEALCSLSQREGELVPGVTVDVEIVTGQAKEVPALPRNAVFPEGDRHYVWVVRDGKAARRFIETGRASTTLIEVTGGLAVRDRVIVPGNTAIREGLSVRPAGS